MEGSGLLPTSQAISVPRENPKEWPPFFLTNYTNQRREKLFDSEKKLQNEYWRTVAQAHR